MRLKLRRPHLKKRKKNTVGGSVATTAVAAMTAAGMLVGGSFSSPSELLDDQRGAVVQTLDLTAQPADDGGGTGDSGSEEESAPEEEKRGLYAAARRRMLQAPRGVRAVIGVPLWALGTALITLLSALWSTVLSPLAVTVLNWLGIALLAALLFTLAVKAVFPDMPLKRILNRRTLTGIGVLCLLFGIADAALPFFWEDYRMASQLLRVAGSLLCTGVPLALYLRRRLRRKPEEITAEPVETPAAPEPPALTPEEKERASRELVAELADSVCQKLY